MMAISGGYVGLVPGANGERYDMFVGAKCGDWARTTLNGMLVILIV
jgi:paraquat-inducible protein B